MTDLSSVIIILLKSDYGAFPGYLSRPNEDPKRRVLEEKIPHGEILFTNDKPKEKCTSSFRHLSPCVDSQRVIRCFLLINRL